MRRRASAIVVVTLIVAAIVFAYVQDRVTASGASDYVMRQREAMAAGRGASVTIDQVMRPAVRRSVEQGLAWAAAVLVAGFGAAAVVARRGA